MSTLRAHSMILLVTLGHTQRFAKGDQMTPAIK
jgi:hypothetical protein